MAVSLACGDEVPDFQALERSPIRRAVPGLIERQEFEYVRHGTVNILLFLVVHTGRMEAVCLPKNDAEHYIEALSGFRRRHRLKGVYSVQDGGASHVAAETSDYGSCSEIGGHPALDVGRPIQSTWAKSLSNQDLRRRPIASSR